jgi:CheY-like chemotaxis protein
MTDPVRVVIIEDDGADAALAAAYLRNNADTQYETLRAGSLAEAVPLLAEAHDCILLDLSLPDASGFELLDSVRSLATDSPIVVLTGRDNDQTGPEALRHGAQDYLAKSDVSPGVLRRAVGHAIERQREHVELLRTQAERPSGWRPIPAVPAVWNRRRPSPGQSRDGSGLRRGLLGRPAAAKPRRVMSPARRRPRLTSAWLRWHQRPSQSRSM